MRRLLLLAVVTLLPVTLLVPAASVAASGSATTAAVAVQPLVVKTVRVGGKRVRFVLAVNNDERAFVQMKLRRDGRWRTVASDRTTCRYFDDSHDPTLEVQKRDKQVFVTWQGAVEGVSVEYGGFNVRRRTITMFGSEECAPA